MSEMGITATARGAQVPLKVWIMAARPRTLAASVAPVLVGTAVNAVRGEWQCARVYATVGRSEPALYHAARAVAICRQHDIGDFDLAAAYEGMARASAVAGDADEAERWTELARTAAGACSPTI